jgi:leader peptidase (prepilin peptidase)/N-methyltransferase
MDQILPILAGPFVGSFLGVLIKRLPAGRPILWERSRCETCSRSLGVLDLVPLLSWLSLRGRCAGCGARIGTFEPVIELAGTAVAAVAVVAGGSMLDIWVNCLLGWWLLALGWIDARHFRLPDVLTLPLIVAGLAATWFIDPEGLLANSVGAVAGLLAFQGISMVYRRLRGREGLGGGDAKLLAAGGAWVGVGHLAPVILLAAMGALVWLLALRLRQVPMSLTTATPFGPFLALAIWLVRLTADRCLIWQGTCG